MEAITYKAGEKNNRGDTFKVDLIKISPYPVNGRIEKIYSEVMNTRIDYVKLQDKYNNLNRLREKIATIADEYLKVSALSNFSTTELREIIISGIEAKMAKLEVDIEVMERHFNYVINERN